MNQVDEAKVIYEMILKVYPDDPAAFYAQDGIAWCHSYKGEDVLALEARQKLKDMMAVTTSSFSFYGLNELGIADSMFNQKNYEDSYQLYEKFARENPKAAEAPSALYRAAMSLLPPALLHAGYRPVEEARNTVPQRQGFDARALPDRRHAVPRAEVREAIAAYREILAADPKGPGAPIAHLRLAQAAFNAKDDAGPSKRFRRLSPIFPRPPRPTTGSTSLRASSTATGTSTSRASCARS